MAEIDSLEIKIKGNTDDIDKKLAQLSSNLTNFSRKTKTASDLMAQLSKNAFNDSGLVSVGKALKSFGKNTSKIDVNGISNVASGMSKLSSALTKFEGVNYDNSIKNLPVVAKSISALSSSLKNIPSVDLSWLESLSKSISSIGKTDINTVLNNLPLLANELKNTMSILSNAPTVSQNLIDMTNALAALGNSNISSGISITNSRLLTFSGICKSLDSAFSKVYNGVKKSFSGIKSLALRIKNLGKANDETGSSFDRLASKIGKFYASCFLAVRALKKVGSAIMSAMDYVETYNFWGVSLNKIENEFSDQFERFGYESAEAYAESFGTRLKELLGKMTGYEIGEKGEAFLTMQKNLGLDVEQLMAFQARIMAVTNSVGLFGEASISTAKALSMLSSDLSSLFNEDLSTVMKNLQSGLIGQSRALYKYGIDITNATLAQYALEHGITKNTAAMTQNEKMQLRMLAILDQSRVAWGDQANTLNSVANQYRLMKQQISNLARTIGSLFLPIIQKVLPYINGLIMAINKLLTFLGFKIWGDNWLSNLLESANSVGGLSDDMEDLAEDMDDVTNSAKAMKGQLSGLDELNNLSSGSSSGSNGGLGGAFDLTNDLANALADYEKEWNKAFENMQNKAQEIADKIEKAFLHMFSPIQRAWDMYGEPLKKSFMRTFEALKSLFKTIFTDLDAVWQQDKTVQIFRDLFSILKSIVDITGYLATNLEEAWKYNDNGYNTLVAIRDIIEIITGNVRMAFIKAKEWAKNLNFEPLFSSASKYVKSLEPVVDTITMAITGFYTDVLLPLGKWAIEKGLPDLLDIFTDLNGRIDWERLNKMISKFYSHLEPFGEEIGEGLIKFVGKLSDSLATWLENGGYEKLEEWLGSIQTWMDNFDSEEFATELKNIFDDLSNIITKIAELGGTIVEWIGGDSLTDAVANIKDLAGGFVVLWGGVKLFKGVGSILTNIGLLKTAFSGLSSSTAAASTATAGISGAIAAVNATTIGLTLVGVLSTAWGFAWTHSDTFKETEDRIGESMASTMTSAIQGANLDRQIADQVFNLDPFDDAAEKAGEESVGYLWDAVRAEAAKKVGDSSFNIMDSVIKATDLANSKSAIQELVGTVADATGQIVQNTETDYTKLNQDYNSKIKPLFSSSEWSKNSSNVSNSIHPTFDSLSKDFEGIGTTYESSIEPYFTSTKWKANGDNITNGLDPAFKNVEKNMPESFRKAIEDSEKAVSSFLERLNKSLKDAGTSLLDGVAEATKNLQNQKISLNANGQSIQGYATGGFPEDGLFFANHGELVGQFSNGRTAVANNEQIVQGIQSGVAYAVSGVVAPYLQQLVQSNNEIASKDIEVSSDGIFRNVRNTAYQYNKRTGRDAFSF